VQTVVAIGFVRWPRLRLAYYALMLVVAGASLATWQGTPSILAAAATTLSTIGRMQRNETSLRALLLATTPFWSAHDLIVGSLPGLIADLLSMATGAAMLLRRSLMMPAAAKRPKEASGAHARVADGPRRQSMSETRREIRARGTPFQLRTPPEAGDVRRGQVASMSPGCEAHDGGSGRTRRSWTHERRPQRVEQMAAARRRCP
jgi:hypothetical protein